MMTSFPFLSVGLWAIGQASHVNCLPLRFPRLKPSADPFLSPDKRSAAGATMAIHRVETDEPAISSQVLASPSIAEISTARRLLNSGRSHKDAFTRRHLLKREPDEKMPTPRNFFKPIPSPSSLENRLIDVLCFASRLRTVLKPAIFRSANIELTLLGPEKARPSGQDLYRILPEVLRNRCNL
jgi:hypothetical protein